MLNKVFTKILVLVLPFILCDSLTFGQEITGGTVQYEEYIKFDYSLFGDDPYVKEWAATMPRGTKSYYILSFNSDKSLYAKSMLEKNIQLDKKTRTVKEKLDYIQPPNPVLQKVYNDFEKNRRIVKVEFMTRLFLIESDIQTQYWKPGGNQRKIQGYICMDATMKIGERTITAWFTPNIPISVGPKEFYGLPGLILAVDVSEENVLLATAVDLTPPSEDSIIKPSEGKRVKKEAFDKLVTEKIKEYKENQKSQSRAKGDYKKF